MHIFVPERNVIVGFEPGTGDNLQPEDFEAGFNDYINWSIKGLDTIELDDDPIDGGMIMFNNTVIDYNVDLEAAIPSVLEDALGDSNLSYIILEEKNVPERGEVSTMLTLSTAHLLETTRNALDDEPRKNALFLSVYPKADFGWFIYLDCMSITKISQMLKDIEMDPNDGRYGEWKNHPDLIRCILYAKKRGFDVLCFDSDADPLQALPTYEEEEQACDC